MGVRATGAADVIRLRTPVARDLSLFAVDFCHRRLFRPKRGALELQHHNWEQVAGVPRPSFGKALLGTLAMSPE